MFPYPPLIKPHLIPVSTPVQGVTKMEVKFAVIFVFDFQVDTFSQKWNSFFVPIVIGFENKTEMDQRETILRVELQNLATKFV